MARLQQALLATGQHIPGVARDDRDDLIHQARVTVSSHLRLGELPSSGSSRPLTESQAMMLPVSSGSAPQITLLVDVTRPTTLRVTLRVARRPDEHTPRVVLAECNVQLGVGDSQEVPLDLPATFETPRYAFWCLDANPDVAVHTSNLRVSGVLAVFHRQNGAVAKAAVQMPPEDSGIESFEFWTPERRPGGRNLAIRIEPPVDLFGVEQMRSGVNRPTSQPNLWVADPADPRPTLTCSWSKPCVVERVEIVFDTDYDHPMESVLMGHPERIGPFCVRDAVLRDETGREMARLHCNHQTRRTVRLDPPATLSRLVLEVSHPGAGAPAAIVDLRTYGPDGRPT
jgi:hypothetical protein